MAATAAPTRTHHQRMQALQHANDVRARRSRLKRLMRAGLVDYAGVVANPPPYLQSMRVYVFLRAIPYCGPSKTSALMRRVMVAESKTIGGLSTRQRADLAAELHAYCKGSG